MDILIEIILEIIFEGVIYATNRRNVPLVLRILFALLIIGFYLFLIGAMVYAAIKYNNMVLLCLALALFIIIGLAVYRKYLELYR